MNTKKLIDYKHIILVAIVGVEIAGAVRLGTLLFQKWKNRNSVLGTQIVTKINKDEIISSKDKYLLHYFEPRPGIITDKPPWLSYVATYHINLDTINSLRDFTVDKPPNYYRIITLGDSFTFGELVSTPDNYPSQLEKLLNDHHCENGKNFEVINLGVYAYDIQYSVERYARRGVKYQADLVLWLVNEHNLIQVRDILTSLEEKIYNETTQNDRRKHFDKGDYYFAAIQAQDDIRLQIGDDKIFFLQRLAFNRFSQLYKGPLIISIFPWGYANSKSIVTHYIASRPNTFLNDTLPPLQNIKNSELSDHHPTAYGHTIIANNILQYLTKNKIISCK